MKKTLIVFMSLLIIESIPVISYLITNNNLLFRFIFIIQFFYITYVNILNFHIISLSFQISLYNIEFHSHIYLVFIYVRILFSIYQLNHYTIF